MTIKEKGAGILIFERKKSKMTIEELQGEFFNRGWERGSLQAQFYSFYKDESRGEDYRSTQIRTWFMFGPTKMVGVVSKRMDYPDGEKVMTDLTPEVMELYQMVKEYQNS